MPVNPIGLKIPESQIRELTEQGVLFTKDNPKYPDACDWDKVEMVTASYMGLKLFMDSKSVYMAHRVRGMKDPDGKVTPIQIVR